MQRAAEKLLTAVLWRCHSAACQWEEEKHTDDGFSTMLSMQTVMKGIPVIAQA